MENCSLPSRPLFLFLSLSFSPSLYLSLNISISLLINPKLSSINHISQILSSKMHETKHKKKGEETNLFEEIVLPPFSWETKFFFQWRWALRPPDGRCSSSLDQFRFIMSEVVLIKGRVELEIAWLMELAKNVTKEMEWKQQMGMEFSSVSSSHPVH